MANVYHPLKNLHRVYCAGPLFNAAERREMEQIAQVLMEAGFEPFVPHADGMEFAQVRPYLVSCGHEPEAIGRMLHEAVFALDVYQVILGCGSLVMNMNGRVPDEGAVAEMSMAWMLGKPIVIFKEDVRSKIVGRDNPLLVGQTGFQHVHEMERLGTALRARHAELAPDKDFVWNCPITLQETLELGERLSRSLIGLGALRPAAEVAEIVLELFGVKGLSPRAVS